MKKGNTGDILMIGSIVADFHKNICFREKIYCYEIFPENMCKTIGRGGLKILAVFAKIILILL